MAYHSKPYSKRLHLCRGWSKLIAAALMMVACACASQVAAQGPEADNKLSAAQMAQALANPDPSGLLQREAELQGQQQGQAQALAMSQYLECTDPSVADLDYNLPLGADIIITGVVVAAGPGRALCQAPAVNATAAATNSSAAAGRNSSAPLEALPSFETTNLATNLLEVQVHCVHKGLVACRAGPADSEDVCTVLVEAPAGGAGPACGVVQGTKYMLLLANSTNSAISSAAASNGTAGAAAAASCDGKYSTMYPSIVQSVRAPLGLKTACMPYPAFPAPDFIVAAVAGCPGDAAGACGSNPCESVRCGRNSTTSCLAKTCPGKLMLSNIIMPPTTCAPVLYSRAVGLPVTSCSEADRRARLQRQALREEVRAKQAANSKAGQIAASQERPQLDTSLETIMGGVGLPVAEQQAAQQQAAQRQQGQQQQQQQQQAGGAGARQQAAVMGAGGRRRMALEGAVGWMHQQYRAAMLWRR